MAPYKGSRQYTGIKRTTEQQSNRKRHSLQRAIGFQSVVSIASTSGQSNRREKFTADRSVGLYVSCYQMRHLTAGEATISFFGAATVVTVVLLL